MSENDSPSNEGPASGPNVAFETLWARVLESWDDPKTHGALLEYAIHEQLLAEAAGRYRALKDDPDKGAEAKKRLEGIVLATTSLLMATATPPTRAKTTLRTITVITFIGAVAVMFWLAWAMLAGR